MPVTASFTIDEAALSRELLPILHRRLSSIQRRVANQARADVPVRTGNLGRSIREDNTRTTGPYSVAGGVTAHTHYAAAVHEGSRPHIIRPRRPGGWLRFNVGNRVVFARMVRHPGTRARPFLRNAAERVVAAER